MDHGDGALNSFYHHHHHRNPSAAAASSAAVSGMFSSPADVLFPHAVSGRASAAPAPVSVPTEPVRRKRGRPRKYGVSATKSPSASGSLALGDPSRRKETAFSRKVAQLGALGNAGQGFTPHVITVSVGEDVTQKIMSFIQQRKQAVCILSSSGSISNVSLRQPAALGGNVTYEGRFEILSLSGSFLESETAGALSNTGGINICLSGADGRIVGGGVGGPLIAAGPVQVIVGSFSIDVDKDFGAPRVDDSSKPQSSERARTPIHLPTTFRSVETSGRIGSSRESEDSQSVGGRGSNNHTLQSRLIRAMSSSLPADWRMGRCDSSDHNGGAYLSPEREDEYHIRD